MAGLDEVLANADLPIGIAITQQDIVDIHTELLGDPALRAAMELAPKLRHTLVALDISPANAIQALAFAIGLIAKHDLEDGPVPALLAAATPIVFGNLNTKRT